MGVLKKLKACVRPNYDGVVLWLDGSQASARGDAGDAPGRMLRRDPCIECGQPVFLAERLIVSSTRLLYHRTCFRCARCNSQLSLANYYETEDGRFCCETCPDEEKHFGETDRAPLATGDESSSSDPSRPPSVTVDTNDLSNDACERVNNVDTVESCETEDYAKDRTDPSLSRVQLRRKLFENVPKDVFDSGQLNVPRAQVSTNKDELPEVKEDEPSVVKEVKHPSKSKNVDSVSSKSLEVDEVLSKSVKVDDIPAKTLQVDDISAKTSQVDDVLAKTSQVDDVSAKTSQVDDVSAKTSQADDVSAKTSQVDDVSAKTSEVGDVSSKSSRVEDISAKSSPVKEISAKFSRLGDISAKATAVEDDPLESRVEVEDDVSKSGPKGVEPSISIEVKEPPSINPEEDELAYSEGKEDQSLESMEKEGEPSISKGKERVLPRGEGNESLESEDDRVINEEIKVEKPSIEIIALSKDGLQSDDNVLSRTEDDKKQMERRVEVEPPLSEKKDETQSRNDDDEANEVEEKNDHQKEIKIVLPPRPPPPSVETMQKPPVTPRKASPLASPRKSSPFIAPREKSPARPLSYPDELNPFADDEKEDIDDFKEVSQNSSNPFGSEDEEEVTLRQKERPPRPSKPPQRPYTHHGVSVKKDVTPATTYVDTRRHIPAPANLNPFWDDGEEPEDDEEDEKPKLDSTQLSPQKPPVPKPRTVLSLASDTSPGQAASPFSDRSNLTRSSGRFGSANSLSSVVSSASTMRRKKHAAPPPPVTSANSTLSPRATSFSPGNVSVPSSPTLSSGRSTLGRSRKSRPAPKPPVAALINSNRSTWNPSTHYGPPSSVPPTLTTSTPKSAQFADDWQEGKFNKDEMNRSKQNQLSAGYTGDPTEEPAEEGGFQSVDKSSHGQWKRKKGPAPPRPIPQRRQIRAIPLKELKRELDDIEVLQLELERQGVNLERTIRRKFDEIPDASESSMTPDIEDLVLQLFELVNEKNELFRKQAELMYLRRQQRLEEEHADLEYQIRVLMDQPERNKTDSDKAKEEKLIQRLVEVVERRNEIVECLEMDRLREAEEDHSIHSRLELFASKSLALNDAYINDLYKSTPALTCCARKEKKKKKDKTKKGTLRLHKKEKQVDADKDIDETEVEQTAKEKKTKRKWF